MKYFYGYISGTYLFSGRFTKMLTGIKPDVILQNTFEGSTEESPFGDFGLEDGWSSYIADKCDLYLDNVANPIRAILDLLYTEKYEQAEFLLNRMFQSTVSLSEIGIACCDKLLKYDENGKRFDFLEKHIPQFKTIVIQRHAALLKDNKDVSHEKQEV